MFCKTANALTLTRFQRQCRESVVLQFNVLNLYFFREIHCSWIGFIDGVIKVMSIRPRSEFFQRSEIIPGSASPTLFGPQDIESAHLSAQHFLNIIFGINEDFANFI